VPVVNCHWFSLIFFIRYYGRYVTVTYGLRYVGAYVRNARNIGGDMLARSEAVLYWLGSGVAVAFIGLVVVAPERVDRTMMDILTKMVTAVVAASRSVMRKL
jgi:hypothetical protein